MTPAPQPTDQGWRDVEDPPPLLHDTTSSTSHHHLDTSTGAPA